MKFRLGINGFGRIGRCLLRAHSELPADIKSKMPIVALNSGTDDPAELAYLLKYDSTHGVWNKNIDADNNTKSFSYGDGDIKTFNYSEPGNIPWKEIGVDIVLECSGRFNNVESSSQHFKGGAKFVIVSAPCDGCENNIIVSVNESNVNQIKQHPESVISVGSCTTNALLPLVYFLDNALDITEGYMTTVHAYTNDQNILDARHKDRYRSRAAAVSMIPTSTGVSKMLGKIIPKLKGKIQGNAIRVPVHNVSLIDFVFSTEKKADPNLILKIIQEAALRYPDVVSINQEKLVSVDFNHTRYSTIFDATQTSVGESGRFIKIAAWYDNEWGFVNRMLDVVKLFTTS